MAPLEDPCGGSGPDRPGRFMLHTSLFVAAGFTAVPLKCPERASDAFTFLRPPVNCDVAPAEVEELYQTDLFSKYENE